MEWRPFASPPVTDSCRNASRRPSASFIIKETGVSRSATSVVHNTVLRPSAWTARNASKEGWIVTAQALRAVRSGGGAGVASGEGGPAGRRS